MVQGRDQREFQLSRQLRGARTDTSDELLDTIIRAEAGGGWWTLMHRFNLASSLLEQKCSPQAAESVASAAAAAAKIYVWLRYSSQRKLTWQRNYNVKPRELSAAQSKLTRVIAKLYCESPHLRDVTRLMLGTVGKGGEGGQGQQIRDEILNIMHRNGIPEKKGIWMEEWHQKLHNNTTPDDIIICEAYLAFLKADMDLSEYWRVLGEGASPASDSSRSSAPSSTSLSRGRRSRFPSSKTSPSTSPSSSPCTVAPI